MIELIENVMVTVQGRSTVVTTSVVPVSYERLKSLLRAKNVYGG